MDAYNYFGTFAWTIGTIVAVLLFGLCWALLNEHLTEAAHSQKYFTCIVLVVLLVLLFAGTVTGGIAAYRASHPVKSACSTKVERSRSHFSVIQTCDRY